MPVPLERYATAISTKGLFSEDANGPDQMIFSDWKPKQFQGVPFVLTDPEGQTKANMILLHGPNSPVSARMPRSVSVPCNTSASAIHLLSGASGWGFPFDRNETVSMIVRLHYVDGVVEDHDLINGIHFADYIGRVDVPKSDYAFALRGQQIRYLAIHPERTESIETIEFVKGDDRTSPMVMAVTVEPLSRGK